MGARLKVREVQGGWDRWSGRWTNGDDYAIDIQRDRHGEFFELRVPVRLHNNVEPLVLQAEPRKRHLLLLVRKTEGKTQNDRFLCGHDEREWFVAAVPGGASSVRQAMDALQPAEVREALSRRPVSSRKRHARKNRAFRRQGEWFFVPEADLEVDEKLVLHDEPMQRGGGKPHIVEYVFRSGGETVRVCSRYPNGLTEATYRALLQRQPQAVRWGWRVMRRAASVYARGAVRHADHAVITLPCWHRVVMNTETQTRTMANVAFLD